MKPRKLPTQAGVHVLLFPAWKKMQRRLRSVAGAKAYLALPPEDQARIYRNLCVIASSRRLTPPADKWLCDLYRNFPELTLFALQGLRKALHSFRPNQKAEVFAVLGYFPSENSKEVLGAKRSNALHIARQSALELDSLKATQPKK